MARLVGMGLYTEADEQRIRRAGREVIALVEAAAPPFDDQWTDWRATPDLIVREVPDGWQRLSTSL
jgi:hypothetical protein